MKGIIVVSVHYIIKILEANPNDFRNGFAFAPIPLLALKKSQEEAATAAAFTLRQQKQQQEQQRLEFESLQSQTLVRNQQQLHDGSVPSRSGAIVTASVLVSQSTTPQQQGGSVVSTSVSAQTQSQQQEQQQEQQQGRPAVPVVQPQTQQ